MKRFIFLLAALLLLNSFAWAGGFQIYEHGASSTGMANARTAIADDVNALYYNPAAITELEGLQFQLGTTGILPLVHYEAAGPPENIRTYPSYQNGTYIEKPVNDGENSIDAKIKGFTPIHLYATYRFDDLGISVGYGLNNPFGLGMHWDGDWDGKYVGTETEIQTFFNQPTIAVDIAKLAGFKDRVKLSVAAGYNFVYGTAQLGRKTDLRVGEVLSIGELEDPWGQLSMFGTAVGHGFNLAVYAELPGLLSFGASVRSAILMPFSGDAKFKFNDAGRQTVDLLGMSIPDKTTGSVDITLPWNMNFGVAFLGIENLKIAADAYVAFFESYDQLELKFSCVEEGTCSEGLNADPVEKNWGQSWQFSLGAEYVIAGRFVVRAGAGIVTTPVPDEHYDPSLPDGLRNIFSGGLGYVGSWWKVDLGYMLAMWEGEKDNLVGAGDDVNPEGMANGKYTTKTHLLALSLSAWF
ncbi:OmpP1/FadL family transporter [Myxococcota bacterium]